MRTGFAALTLRWEEPDGVVAYCRRRGVIHGGLTNGSSGLLPNGFATLITALRRRLARACPPRRRRGTSDTLVHYAFTMACVEDEPDVRGLYALLDPSLIGFTDDASGMLDETAYTDRLREGHPIMDEDGDDAFAVAVGLPDGGRMLASWAAVVLVGAHDADRMRVERLEETIQTAWLAAWLAQGMAERVLDADPSQVRSSRIAWQCIEYEGMEYWNRRRGDPSETAAVARLRRVSETTSGLQWEWDVAAVALDRARRIGMLIESDRDSLQSAVLDVLLLLVSLTSLAQLLYAVPLDGWSVLWEHWARTLGIVIPGLIGAALIIRLRR